MIAEPEQPVSRPEHSGYDLQQLRQNLRIRAAMAGKPKLPETMQLIGRFDLFGDYLFRIPLIVLMFEIPLFLWRSDAVRYVLLLGWLIQLVSGIRRMWLGSRLIRSTIQERR